MKRRHLGNLAVALVARERIAEGIRDMLRGGERELQVFLGEGIQASPVDQCENPNHARALRERYTQHRRKRHAVPRLICILKPPARVGSRCDHPACPQRALADKRAIIRQLEAAQAFCTGAARRMHSKHPPVMISHQQGHGGRIGLQSNRREHRLYDRVRVLHLTPDCGHRVEKGGSPQPRPRALVLLRRQGPPRRFVAKAARQGRASERRRHEAPGPQRNLRSLKENRAPVVDRADPDEGEQRKQRHTQGVAATETQAGGENRWPVERHRQALYSARKRHRERHAGKVDHEGAPAKARGLLLAIGRRREVGTADQDHGERRAFGHSARSCLLAKQGQ